MRIEGINMRNELKDRKAKEKKSAYSEGKLSMSLNTQPTKTKDD